MREAGLLRLDFSLPQLHKPPLYLALSASLKRLSGLDVDTGVFLEGLSNRNLEMSVEKYSLDKSSAYPERSTTVAETATVRAATSSLGPTLFS